jgi:ABC-2 type transport system permease protein
VRRELWEHRSLYAAPLAMAAVVLLAYLVGTLASLPGGLSAGLTPGDMPGRVLALSPYDFAALPMILLGFVVGAFYSLDALHGERRDRALLFWKSLPVSDLTTVLSKACIPLAVLPLIIFAVTVAAQIVMLLVGGAVAMALHPGALAPWRGITAFFEESVILLYGLLAMALWHAPLYGWLLLVSAWARRAALLWAVLPPLAFVLFERVAFGSQRFAGLLGGRVTADGLDRAIAFPAQGTPSVTSLEQLTPLRFLATPGLWIGLALSAAFLAAAVHLRRRREVG